jgi:hypothetical protein
VVLVGQEQQVKVLLVELGLIIAHNMAVAVVVALVR